MAEDLTPLHTQEFGVEMSNRYLFDTNAIIYLMNGRLAFQLPEGEYSVSVITEIELLPFPSISESEEQKIDDLEVAVRPIISTLHDEELNASIKKNELFPSSPPPSSAQFQ